MSVDNFQSLAIIILAINFLFNQFTIGRIQSTLEILKQINVELSQMIAKLQVDQSNALSRQEFKKWRDS